MTIHKRLEGRAVLVTGASRGIGRAIAIGCAQAGATAVGVGYRASREEAEKTAHAIAEHGAHAKLLELDVASPKHVDAAIEAFTSDIGHLDALVANAGVVRTGLLASASALDLDEMVRVNVLGPIACARAALPAMLRQKKGVLCFIGSVAASRPARGQAAYAATKASVEALTKALAVEYGRKGIRAVCVRPGAVDTAMLGGVRATADEELHARIPMHRVALPGEIARMVITLLSDDASYVSGAIIDVDGGYAVGG